MIHEIAIRGIMSVSRYAIRTPKVHELIRGAAYHCVSSKPDGSDPSTTQVYMSPEAQRGTYSDLSDMFAFGVVALEVLTGLGPSPGEGI